MMERMGYDFTKESGLNFGKRTSTTSIICTKRLSFDYYHKTQRELGYVTTPVSSDSESEEEVYHDSSSTTSSWDSDVNISDIFGSLSVNMVLISHLKDDGENTFELKN